MVNVSNCRAGLLGAETFSTLSATLQDFIDFQSTNQLMSERDLAAVKEAIRAMIEDDL